MFSISFWVTRPFPIKSLLQILERSKKKIKNISCINLSNNPTKGHKRGEAVITNVKDNNI